MIEPNSPKPEYSVELMLLPVFGLYFIIRHRIAKKDADSSWMFIAFMLNLIFTTSTLVLIYLIFTSL
jgi:hypothetical protein